MRYLIHLNRLSGYVLLASFAAFLSIRLARADEVARQGQGQMVVHAVGAQVYTCNAQAQGGLAWGAPEPAAELFLNGTFVGVHSKGPTWALTDGSRVMGKVTHVTQAANAGDIPLLDLDVLHDSGSGRGVLADAMTVRRSNTRGGAVHGGCAYAGQYVSVPYEADYTFTMQ